MPILPDLTGHFWEANQTLEGYSTHAPVLAACVQATSGPVLEVGCGIFSSPLLEAMCRGRRLLTVDGSERWMNAMRFAAHREAILVQDWTTLPFEEPWSVVFIDDGLANFENRRALAARCTHAEFVVLHDAEEVAEYHFHYREIYHLFRHRVRYTRLFPHTACLSNMRDPAELFHESWIERLP